MIFLMTASMKGISRSSLHRGNELNGPLPFAVAETPPGFPPESGVKKRPNDATAHRLVDTGPKALYMVVPSE